MNILQKTLFKFALKMAGSSSYSVSDAALGDVLARLSGSKTYTGKNIDSESAMQISTVWACNRILCETIGSLPGAMYEKQGENWIKIDHQVGNVLRLSPNPDMTGTEYIEASTANLNLHGNAYSFRNVGTGGELVSLYPIPATQCRPMRNKETGVISYDVYENGKWENYPREKIWHVKGFGTDGLIGLSPIQYAKQAMGISLAMEEFSGRFFSQGAKTAGIIRIPTFLKDDQREAARKSLEGQWSGMENAHKMRLLEGGIEYEPVTMPLDDAQFLQSRGFQMEEICRIYRIPPHMVADLERATFSNIEQMSLEFVIYTLLPWLTRYESSITRWLIRPQDRTKYRFRFNFEGLLRGDAKSRSELYSSALQNGWMNRNEVRSLENLNSSTDEGMDDFTVQTNLSPLDLLGAMIQRQNAKPAAGAPVSADTPDAGDSTDAAKALQRFAANLNLQLPDSFKHDFNHRIDLPSIVALASEVKRGNETNALLIRLFEKEFGRLQEAITAPRVGVYDEAGELIGSRIQTTH